MSISILELFIFFLEILFLSLSLSLSIKGISLWVVYSFVDDRVEGKGLQSHAFIYVLYVKPLNRTCIRAHLVFHYQCDQNAKSISLWCLVYFNFIHPGLISPLHLIHIISARAIVDTSLSICLSRTLYLSLSYSLLLSITLSYSLSLSILLSINVVHKYCLCNGGWQWIYFIVHRIFMQMILYISGIGYETMK